jgi:hypothetical protein
MWVRWRPGDEWAIVEGAAQDVATAFDVPVNDYRGRKGQVSPASPQQPSVPEPFGGVVTALGRILGYAPHRTATLGLLPLDVPNRGLSPPGCWRHTTPNALAVAGFTGKGATIEPGVLLAKLLQLLGRIGVHPAVAAAPVVQRRRRHLQLSADLLARLDRQPR